MNKKTIFLILFFNFGPNFRLEGLDKRVALDFGKPRAPWIQGGKIGCQRPLAPRHQRPPLALPPLTPGAIR